MGPPEEPHPRDTGQSHGLLKPGPLILYLPPWTRSQLPCGPAFGRYTCFPDPGEPWPKELEVQVCSLALRGVRVFQPRMPGDFSTSGAPRPACLAIWAPELFELIHTKHVPISLPDFPLRICGALATPWHQHCSSVSLFLSCLDRDNG